LQALEETGIGAGTGAKRFHGQGLMSFFAQVAEQQGCQNCFSDTGASSRDEEDAAHGRRCA
jgi:hypothetical protein